MTHVLIVEDDPSTRDGLAQVLELEGFSVSRAENGRVALSLLQAGLRPGVIVLDLVMPVMDGLRFLKGLRATQHAPVPVLVVTAVGDQVDLENLALDIGCPVFSKTGPIEPLLEALRQVGSSTRE
ncbi:response regulator transcription factor [Lysobacter humi (ex Lee et al. 2017)]